MSPVALLTGTSSGIGLHAAVELARRGHTVVATMRDTGRAGRLRDAADAAGVTLDVRALDVTDHAAATALVEQVHADHGRLDVLVNNAGQGLVGTAEQLTLEQVQAQLDVNYLGPVNLTRAVMPLMRGAGQGRILTVSSVGGVVGQPFADAYCGAKFAIEGFMQSLAPVARSVGVWVSVIEPAAVGSDFVDNGVRIEPGAYGAQLDAYLARAAGSFANAQSPSDAGAAVADAATSADYRFRWQTSDAARTFAGLSLSDLDGSGVVDYTGTWIAPPTS